MEQMLWLLKIVLLSRVTGYHLTTVLLLALQATSILQVIYLLTGVFSPDWRFEGSSRPFERSEFPEELNEIDNSHSCRRGSQVREIGLTRRGKHLQMTLQGHSSWLSRHSEQIILWLWPTLPMNFVAVTDPKVGLPHQTLRYPMDYWRSTEISGDHGGLTDLWQRNFKIKDPWQISPIGSLLWLASNASMPELGSKLNTIMSSQLTLPRNLRSVLSSIAASGTTALEEAVGMRKVNGLVSFDAVKYIYILDCWCSLVSLCRGRLSLLGEFGVGSQDSIQSIPLQAIFKLETGGDRINLFIGFANEVVRPLLH